MQAGDTFDAALFTSQLIGGLDRPLTTSFIHIIRAATITKAGDVFTSNVKIILPACKVDLSTQPPNFNKKNIIDEVFTIAQNWGGEYFHGMMENMPRLALFLPFLRQHPNIRIHVARRNRHFDTLFRVLGLDPNRMIIGKVHGKLVYLPQPSVCHFPLISEGQMLAYEYQKYITTNMTGNKNWDSVVLIKRTKKRRLIQQSQIETLVRQLADSYGYRYVLFSDNPTPSTEETMLIFYRARFVIAPHGAGLSNVLFSRPGTYILEIACGDRPMCFLTTAYQLGHRYFGLPANGSCANGVNVNIEYVETVLNRTLAEDMPRFKYNMTTK